jgi:Ca2+-transporting ATPase
VLGRVFLANRPLLGSALLLVALQLATLYLPIFQGVFGTVSLTATELAACFIASTIMFWVVEVEKCLRRRAQAL